MTTTARIPSTSVEEIWVPVRQDHPINGETDLSVFDVDVAVVPIDTEGEPAVDDWQTATWEASTWTGEDGLAYYLATVTFGTGALDLGVDSYRAWVRIDSAVVVRGGRILVIDV